MPWRFWNAPRLCIEHSTSTSAHKRFGSRPASTWPRYVLIDVLELQQEPDIHVQVSTMNERDVEAALRSEPEISFGLAAPYHSSAEIEYLNLFAMGWSVITERGHHLALASKRRLTLHDTATRPSILYERGSTGRQHVLDAFHELHLVPRVAFKTTSTETIVSMVEAGLGVSIVPLLPSGVVTRGRRVHVRHVPDRNGPIHSGILLRRGNRLSAAASRLLAFTRTRGSTNG